MGRRVEPPRSELVEVSLFRATQSDGIVTQCFSPNWLFIGWTTWLKLRFQSTTAGLTDLNSRLSYRSIIGVPTWEADIRSPWGRGCVSTRRNPLSKDLNPLKCWTLLILMFIYSIQNTGHKWHRWTLTLGTYCYLTKNSTYFSKIWPFSVKRWKLVWIRAWRHKDYELWATEWAYLDVVQMGCSKS